jgi:glycosyltransferase involved in cell wall biosynthesis
MPVLGGFDANPVALARSMTALKRAAAEILVTITPRDPRTAGVAARMLGIPVLLRQPVRAGFRTKLRHRFFYQAIPTHYVANSNATRSAILASASWVDPAAVSVVHNGVDIDHFATATPADLGVPPGALTIGFVGRIEVAKGIRELMAAWPIIASNIAEAHLVVVGTAGDAEGEFTAWSLGRDRVHVLGPRRDMPAVMAAIDLLALPSHNEGFGLAVIEAMAARAAIVVADGGALRELVDDGVEGRVVPVGDSSALAGAIIEIAGNASLREAMGAAAHARARRDFSVERMIDEYERLLRRIRTGRASGQSPA